MKILITGSSGLIGSALVSSLQADQHEVYKLVRKKAQLLKSEIAWDPDLGEITLPEGLDVVIHLSGESILGAWTASKKERIRRSRIRSTELLTQALCQLQSPPSTFISASAIGYYGNREDEILTEESSPGEGFLAEVCVKWEEATRAAAKKGIRILNIRTGFVVSTQGGGFKQMLPLFKWGLGGKLGSGQQYMSWITIDDLVAVFKFAMQQEQLVGPVNAVTPFPVTNAQWTKMVGHVLHRPTFFSIPAFAIRSILGEMGQELLLNSVRVIPQKLENAGFQFHYPKLEEALKEVCNK